MDEVLNQEMQEQQTQTDTHTEEMESTKLGEKTFTQAEMDKVISERLNRERVKYKKDVEAKILEVTKVAQMTAQERFEHELKQREAAVMEKELEFKARELRIKASDKVNEAGLPTSLLNILDYSDEENLHTNIELLSSIVKECVDKGINERLRGQSLPKNQQKIVQSNNDSFLKGLNKK